MNYRESIEYIESLSPAKQKPSLERMVAFLQENGRPQDQYASIQVAGTNGKGSTVAIMDSVLRQAGYRVGRYTGPHILRFNERIHLNGQPVADETFAKLATSVRWQSESFGARHPEFGQLTWFEFLTAMAFFYFMQQKVDVAVVEVGLGGRWDATTALSCPVATAITCVDLDHTQILGQTIRQIARQKAGIIKAQVPVVTAASGQALQEIVLACQQVGSPLFQCLPPDVVLEIHLGSTRSKLVQGSYRKEHYPYHKNNRTQHRQAKLSSGGQDFNFLLKAASGLSLPGRHQQTNALVASTALMVSGLKLPPVANMQKAFRSVFWPGRLQFIARLCLVLDGAHNPAGARVLRAALKELFPDNQFVFVIGCFQNKDVPEFVSALCCPGDRVIASEASCSRATYPAAWIVDKAAACGAAGYTRQSIGQALLEALSSRRAQEIVVATGSFATIKECMLQLGWQRVEDSLTPSIYGGLVGEIKQPCNFAKPDG